MKRPATFALAILASVAVRADILTTTPLHVGGFFDGGGADNKIEHQNYFVGYGTVCGVRTAERRSFFWYHIPSFEGAVVDVSIKLKMLVSTSLVFGLDPVDPGAHDASESFALGATPFDPLTLVDPDLTTGEAQAIFDALDDHPVASETTFEIATPYSFPMVSEIHLNAAGLGWVGSHRGGDVVLTGWMPTWSHDDRTDGAGHFLEADELLFGFSDVPTLVPPPELTIVYTPVPEPATLAAMAFGFASVRRRRRF